jgi:hypothetical protein
VKDLGNPIAYTVLEPGARVFTSDREMVGKVHEVLADLQVDIFDGLILATGPLGSDHRYIAGEQVEEIFENGVLLRIDSEAAGQLPEPTR